MTSSFGQEMLGRVVQDKKGKELGKLADLVIDVANGEISELLIRCAETSMQAASHFPRKTGPSPFQAQKCPRLVTSLCSKSDEHFCIKVGQPSKPM